MIFLDDFQEQALFRQQETEHWFGEVHMIDRKREAVPFTLANKKFLLTFESAGFVNGQGFFKDMLFKTTDGVFLFLKKSTVKLNYWH